MSELAWLVGYRFQSIAKREFDWVIRFDNDASLTIACLWRLVENGRIGLTSSDNGQQFGLPAPVDATSEVNRRLTDAPVSAVELRRGILDLELRFAGGHILQAIPDSAGYEAWIVWRGSEQFIAVGGGDLAIFGGET